MTPGSGRPGRLGSALGDVMHAEAFLPARPALLEREPEVSAIRELVRSARGGTGRLLVAEGSAGIGKTRLLSEARAAAEASGLEVVAARGGELEQGFAFGIVRQLFEPQLARASSADRTDLMTGAAALVRPLFDESQFAPGPEGAAGASFAMLHGLYWLLAGLAFRQPMLVAVDDLHWADEASLRWIAYLLPPEKPAWRCVIIGGAVDRMASTPWVRRDRGRVPYRRRSAVVVGVVAAGGGAAAAGGTGAGGWAA